MKIQTFKFEEVEKANKFMAKHPPLHTAENSGIHISDGHIVVMYEDDDFDLKAHTKSAVSFALNSHKSKLINLQLEVMPAELEYKRLFPHGVPETNNLIDWFANGMQIKRKQAELMAQVAEKVINLKFTNDREIERLETVVIPALENMLKENV